ncbi:MAG: ABC transporter substrate-binding protein, partial [Deltaproteobacteria bacterium]|nr:ABC transporter substrate-binding protein [Deltaproteobacteria bacterium]
MKILIGLITAVLIFASPVHAREITDMTGKKVSIPDKINKVFSGSPALTYMIYAIDPDLLSGLNYRLTSEEKEYLNIKIQELPVLGGFYGQGNIANVEMILNASPDIIFLWVDNKNGISKNTEKIMMKSLPIPAVNVVLEDIDDYGEAFLFMGEVLGRQERGRLLRDYADDTLRKVKETLETIPEDQRPRVYYAEGNDGLNTECDNSWHSEIISIAGAKNVYHCESRDSYGMEKINIEQVMSYNPDVIVAREKAFY